MTTGTKIRYLREKKKLSQEELAYIVGVSQVTIGNWEQGKSIRHEFLKKLAKALEVSTDFLLEEMQSPNGQSESKNQINANDLEIYFRTPNNFFDDLNKKMDIIISQFRNYK